MPPLKNGDSIGEWLVESPIGQGGMATVYRCRHKLSEQVRAAVKLFDPGDSDVQQKWFLREVESLVSLRHPGIVRILHPGMDVERSLYFLAMELVEGETLRRRLQRGPMSAAEARDLFSGLAEALAEAHSRNIFHRDVKPSNMMIRTDGTPVLLDFGIAALGDPALRTTTFVGTPVYMAPEMFTEQRTDPVRAEVYSLGVVLFEAITGRPPFSDDAPTSRDHRLARVAGYKLRTALLDPGENTDPALRELIRSATARDPARRPATMAEFARALGAGGSLPTLGSLALQSPPARKGEAWRWIAGAVVVALALSALLGALSWWWVMSL